MSFTVGDILDYTPDCPHCDDGERITEMEVDDSSPNCYTYYCGNCDFEIDVVIIHQITEIRTPDRASDDERSFLENRFLLEEESSTNPMKQEPGISPDIWWTCGVEVCDRVQNIGPQCVCDKCADIAYSHGDGGFNEEGERVCDCCYDKPSIGVHPGEGSASYLCQDCWGEWF